MADLTRTWAEVRDEVRDVRRRLWGLGLRLPHSFTFRGTAQGNTRIYFMSSPSNSRENSFFAIDVPVDPPDDPSLITTWIQLLPAGFQGPPATSKEEQLLLERKRMAPAGISAYEFHERSGKFLFSTSSSLFEWYDGADRGPSEVRTPKSTGARLNPEICPGNPNLVAFVNDGDVWVVDCSSGAEERVTNTSKESGLSSGLPSYIVQEEFNRFEGFWWEPVSKDGVYRLLVEEVDERHVKLVNLLTMPGREPEQHRFPVPGSPNAISHFRVIEVIPDEGRLSWRTTELPISIPTIFPWVEYIVRAGWTPESRFIWFQLLDRPQKRLELVLVPLDPEPAPLYVIHSEKTEVWINVHDILAFLPSPAADKVRFLWGSEATGFRHLYLMTAVLREPLTTATNPALHLSPLLDSQVSLTSGEWEVVNAPLGIDYAKGLVFFTALAHCVLERHIYVVSLDDPGRVKRLTQEGFSHMATFGPSLIVLTYSSIESPPVCRLFRILTGSGVEDVSLIPVLDLDSHHGLLSPRPLFQDGFYPPEILNCSVLEGPNIFAMLYRPFAFDESKKYPTILNVYGGPEVQLVYNSYRGGGQLWLWLLASQGYCVLAVDSRGSHHRGLMFEGYLKGRLGTVELLDQVQVLKKVAEDRPCIDESRLGIYGWSYGGYLSLLGLAHFPSIFRAAVAGAPVTSWELYDTAYTERYLGLPEDNPNGYKEGSVLNQVHLFPDEEDRLLLVHGLVDENVHFLHTALLVNALVRAGKPYRLQVYPGERHSLRRVEASEHYETTLLSFLAKALK